jgi:hypothetical protein
VKHIWNADKTITERSVICISGTLYVSIPKIFAQQHQIQPGDRIAMILKKNQLCILPPEK